MNFRQSEAATQAGTIFSCEDRKDKLSAISVVSELCRNPANRPVHPGHALAESAALKA